MEKTVKSCGECPFLEESNGDYYCNSRPAFDDYLGFAIDKSIMDKDCPEGGEFVITTKKLDNDKSK